ncbi:MAG: hypothetical protein H0W31_02600 [Actinobacteria bacterium]|nr:hypothetical protein [Actinomycetota bacterium]
MKRLLTIAALLSLVLAASVALAAPPAGKDKDPASAAEAKAIQACKAERAANMAAFEAKYGTNKNKKNAFGKCVSSKSKHDDEKDEADENKNETNASKKCKAERAANMAEFEAKYGTNKNKKNAHGKCVSKHAKQKS